MSMTRQTRFVAAVTVAGLSAAVAPLTAADGDAAAVRKARVTMNKMLADHDMDGFRTFVDRNMTGEVMLATPAWRSSGHDQVFDTIKSRDVGQRPIMVWDHTPEDITVNEAQNFIAERGTYTQRWQGKGVIDQWTGPYFALWKRFTPGGPWLLDVESFVPMTCTGDDECAPRPAGKAAPLKLPTGTK